MARRNRCRRCDRRLRNMNTADDWNAIVEGGYITGILCPTCQTPDENTEAEINEATTVYDLDPLGRLISRVKRDNLGGGR